MQSSKYLRVASIVVTLAVASLAAGCSDDGGSSSSSSGSSGASSGNTSGGTSGNTSGGTSGTTSGGTSGSSNTSTSSFCCGVNDRYYDCPSSAALQKCANFTNHDPSQCTSRSKACD